MTSPARQVMLATAAKWATVKDRTWGWAIIDEAYQMRSDMLLLIADRFERALFVGDPGQLDPFSIIETPRWIGLPYDPMQNAVTVLQAHNPDLPVHRLPVSWRLPPPAAPVISGAFYPFSGFRAATAPGDPAPGVHRRRDTQQRRRHPGPGRTDRVGTARTARPPHHPHRPRGRRRGSRAGGTAPSRGSRRNMRTAPRRAAAQPGGHRDRSHPPRPGRPDPPGPRPDHPGRRREIRVDTANRLQGAEFEVTIVLHPLSGRRDATAFHLEAGRLCVLTSRHRHACIVVARAGIADLLDAHPSDEPIHLGVPAKFPDGWEAQPRVARPPRRPPGEGMNLRSAVPGLPFTHRHLTPRSRHASRVERSRDLPECHKPLPTRTAPPIRIGNVSLRRVCGRA